MTLLYDKPSAQSPWTSTIVGRGPPSHQERFAEASRCTHSGMRSATTREDGADGELRRDGRTCAGVLS
jgi:hypothetical protein